MPGSLSVQTGLLLVSMLWAGSSCIPEYRPPRYDEPHAVVKARLVYHAWPGPELEQLVTVDGHGVKELPTPVPQGDGVVTRPVLVRPGAVPWKVETVFFHMVTRMVMETYRQFESYPCGKNMCSRSTPRTRWVNRTTRVIDGHCEGGIDFAAAAGATYLVQYDFYAHQRCSLLCFRQIPAADGSFAHQPCAAAPIGPAKR